MLDWNPAQLGMNYMHQCMQLRIRRACKGVQNPGQQGQ